MTDEEQRRIDKAPEVEVGLDRAVTNEAEVEDVDTEAEEVELPFTYSITSYGADYPVDGLVKRMQSKGIVVPEFQREFIWPRSRIDRFVESLLLGLPVPGIFLAKVQETGELLVIDGQQRLRTLECFYRGILREREFALGDGVQEQFRGKTYETLDETDRRRLDDSIIHATIIRQDEPSNDQSSVYFVFERLNTGGMVLQPQEIRAAIFQGEFNELLAELNDYEPWRKIFGRQSRRMKDRELILRFFAFLHSRSDYRRPMKEFLNQFMGSNRDLTQLDPERLRKEFTQTIDLLSAAIDPSSLFRPRAAINAAVFDAVMVGTAESLSGGPLSDSAAVRNAYVRLVGSEDFTSAYSRATADEASVKSRIQLAIDAFLQLK